MALTTYTELKAAIADWLLRSDATTVIPDFIDLAEKDMARKVRHWRMESRSTATLDTRYSALPADFLEPIRVSITSGTTYELELASQAEMLDRRERGANVSGRPLFYALSGGEIEVQPAPDGEYTIEMLYYVRTEALSASNASNWILTYYPDAYLFGALAFSAPYFKEDERIPVWRKMYDEAIAGIAHDNHKTKFGGTGQRLKIRSY